MKSFTKNFKGFKKTKSNDKLTALSTQGATSTVQEPSPSLLSINNQNNQHLSYSQLRLTLRIVQFVCHVFLLGFTGSVSGKLLQETGMPLINLALNIIGVILMLTSILLASLYILKIFHKPGSEGHKTKLLRSFTGPRVLVIETVTDTVASIILIVFFGLYIFGIRFAWQVYKVSCTAGVGGPCDKYNWIITWTFFAMSAWLVALGADIAGWIKLNSSSTSRNVRNDQTEMEIRRLRMTKK